MKKIFHRISDILSANLNALIDQAEDPEIMIRQILREMEENVLQARRSVVEAIAAEKCLEKELRNQQKAVETWHGRAEAGVKSGREELARAALIQKKAHEHIAMGLADNLASANRNSERLKVRLHEIVRKLDTVRCKAMALKFRQRNAEAQSKIAFSYEKIRRPYAAECRFARMEARVTEIEAQAEAMAEMDEENTRLEHQFEVMGTEGEVDRELAAMKEKIAAEESAGSS